MSPPKKESPVCLAAGRSGTGKSLTWNIANSTASRNWILLVEGAQ